jgi:hypothetical protein
VTSSTLCQSVYISTSQSVISFDDYRLFARENINTIKAQYGHHLESKYKTTLTHIYEPGHDKNQHNAFATSMNPDQSAHPRSLIRIHAVRLRTL